MLKKTTNIIMAVLLIVATSGITIYRHYCGTTLMKATVSLEAAKCCKIPCPLCHNETIKLKISDEFSASISGLQTSRFGDIMKMDEYTLIEYLRKVDLNFCITFITQIINREINHINYEELSFKNINKYR